MATQAEATDELAPDVREGELIMFETGEYSDRTWWGPFRALKDFRRRDASEKYIASRPKRGDDEDRWEWAERGGPTSDGFVAWLIRKRFLEEVSPRAHSWHLGSYGEFEPWN